MQRRKIAQPRIKCGATVRDGGGWRKLFGRSASILYQPQADTPFEWHLWNYAKTLRINLFEFLDFGLLARLDLQVCVAMSRLPKVANNWKTYAVEIGLPLLK